MSGFLGLLLYLFIFAYIFSRSIKASLSYKKEKIFLIFIWVICSFQPWVVQQLQLIESPIFIWIITTLILIKISKRKILFKNVKKLNKK